MINRDDLLQSLIEKMVNFMKSLHTQNNCPFGDFKLNRSQIMIMFYLEKNKEGVPTKDIAKMLNVTAGAITQFIAPLVDMELIKREEDKKDRRLLRISITTSAKKKLSTFKTKYYKTISPIFDSLSVKEINEFITLLNKIKLN